jgi:hypothetical protein
VTPGRIRVRAARHDDRAFVVDAAGRLEEIGAPPGRAAGEIVAGETRTLLRFFAIPSGLGDAAGGGKRRGGAAGLRVSRGGDRLFQRPP